MSLRVLDLFSGIGGFSLGLERTGGFKTVAFCEIDPFCRRVLAKHWPEVPCHDDVRTLHGLQYGPIDVVCGGFPCQPYSSASRGRRKGAGDDRALWPEMLRVVAESSPSWVIGENVTHIESMDLERVVSDLEAIGYGVGALEIPACAVGHDHRRPRIWICSYAYRDGKPDLPLNAEVARLSRGDGFVASHSRAAHGLPRGMDAYRRSALGNAVVPQIPELIGRAILESLAAKEPSP